MIATDRAWENQDDDELISDKMANLVRPEAECFHVASGPCPYDDSLVLEQYQPAWEMLVPHGRTCNIASSSSVSVKFEMERRPSDEPERMRGDDTAG